MKKGAWVIYWLGNLGTFLKLTFFDGYQYTWWNWIVAVPVNEFLAAIWLYCTHSSGRSHDAQQFSQQDGQQAALVDSLASLGRLLLQTLRLYIDSASQATT